MNPTPTTVWDDHVFQPASTAHSLSIGGRPLVFSEHTQQLYAHNETSIRIWEAIGARLTLAQTARRLSPRVEDFDTVIGHARGVVAEWLRLGLVTPADLDQPRADPDVQVRLRWLDCCLAVNVFGDLDLSSFNAIFRPFISNDEPTATLDVHFISGTVFIEDPGHGTIARQADEWIPEIKARFTAKILAQIDAGYLVHAALVSRQGRGLLICGSPGAGKSTLSLSLALTGFHYHTDDIVWFADDGEAVGAPFAPALKTGSWPILHQMETDLPASPTYARGDGQSVRYLLMDEPRTAPIGIDAILLLDRRSDETARIEDVEPVEILSTILTSAYSSRAAIGGPALRVLVGRIEAARTGRLVFDAWKDAQRLVDAFAP